MRPGDAAALVLVAEALAIDVWLVRHRHDTISSCVRRSLAAKAIALTITAHLIATLPWDPLTELGDRLRGTNPGRTP